MSVLVNRYVDALFQVAQAAGVAPAVYDDLVEIRTILDDGKNRSILLDPRLASARKRVLFGKVCPNMGELTGRFLDVVLARRRESILPELARAYRRLALAAENRIEGVLETAGPVSGDEIDSLAAAASAAVGMTVELRVVENPKLLGGARLTVGNRMFDGSASAALESMRRRLQSVLVG